MAQKSLTQGFISGLSATSWWNTLSWYYHQYDKYSLKAYLHINLTLGGVVDFGARFGYSKYGWAFLDVNPNTGIIDTTSTTGNIINDATGACIFPRNSQAIYTVLIAGNVTSDQICGPNVGACSSIVHSTLFAWPFTFILTGHHTQCTANGIVCTPMNDILSPNMALTGEVWTDNMLDTLAHELANAVTNYDGQTWVNCCTRILLTKRARLILLTKFWRITATKTTLTDT